jgi:hypothetical protein
MKKYIIAFARFLIILGIIILLFDFGIRYWIFKNRNNGVTQYINAYNHVMNKRVDSHVNIYSVGYSFSLYMISLYYSSLSTGGEAQVREMCKTARALESYAARHQQRGLTRVDIKPFILFSISSKEERRILDSILKNTQISKQSPP